jgi:hypothetical protein
VEGVSFWEWVAMYGLDGIGSGVLGGVIAWALLRRTINHETTLRTGDRQAAELDELRLQLGEVRERAARAMLWVSVNRRESVDLSTLADRIAGLYSALLGAQALAERSAPKLKANLDVLGNALARMDNGVNAFKLVREVCSRAVSHSTIWVATPEEYEEKAVRLDLDELVADASRSTSPTSESDNEDPADAPTP